jgi:hypothetical protein
METPSSIPFPVVQDIQEFPEPRGIEEKYIA